jgi:hypothetical protein
MSKLKYQMKVRCARRFEAVSRNQSAFRCLLGEGEPSHVPADSFGLGGHRIFL